MTRLELEYNYNICMANEYLARAKESEAYIEATPRNSYPILLPGMKMPKDNYQLAAEHFDVAAGLLKEEMESQDRAKGRPFNEE